MTHTPGPWTVALDGDVYMIYAGDAAVAVIGIDEQTRGDCKLIAAAPDLLAACEEALEDGLHDALSRSVQRRIRAAIAQAKGEE